MNWGTYTYTPNPGYVGSDSFTISAFDGVISGSSTISVTVYNSNPMAWDSWTSVLHDHDLTGSVYGYDTDFAPLTFSASGAGNGTVVMDPNSGSYTYTPNSGYVGSDFFTFTANDGVASGTGTVYITVTNTSPTAYSSPQNILHDTVLTASVSGSDMDYDTITFGGAGASNGTVVMDPNNGSYTYTPNVGFVGTDTINFTVSDGTIDSPTNSGTTSGTVTVDVYNTAPTANSSSETVLHTLTLNSSVTGSDANDDALTYSVATGPSHGTLTLNTDGTYVYEPDFTYAGSDSFTFKAHDGAQFSSEGTVSIDVTNTEPVAANDDVFEYPEPWDEYVDIDVLGNDYDPDEGDELTIVSVTSPASGATAQIVEDAYGNQFVRYWPAEYPGEATNAVFSLGTEFQYTVADATGALAQADVTKIELIANLTGDLDFNGQMNGSDDALEDSRGVVLVISPDESDRPRAPIAVSRRIGDATSGTLTLTYPGVFITIYDSSTGGSVITSGTSWDALGTYPTTVYAAASTSLYGSETVTLTLDAAKGDASSSVFDTLTVYVAEIDLDFGKLGDNIEEQDDNIGALIAVNQNDTNMNLVQDNLERTDESHESYVGVLSNDPELIPVVIRVNGLPAWAPSPTLEVANGYQAWKTAKRYVGHPINTDYIPNGMAVRNIPSTIYIEARGQDAGDIKVKSVIGSIETKTWVHVQPVALTINQVPSYLFASAQYATPVKFTVISGGGETNNVSVSDISTDFRYQYYFGREEDFSPKKHNDVLASANVASRFVAGDGPSRGNGSSEQYTAFVPSGTFQSIDTSWFDTFVNQGKLLLNDPYFTMEAFVEKELAPGVIRLVRAVSPFAPNAGAKVGSFMDKRANAVDLGAGSEGRARTFDVEFASKVQYFAKEGGETFQEYEDESAGDGHFSAAGGTFPGGATSSLTDVGTLDYGRTVVVRNISTLAGSYYISYGPRTLDAGILMPGELAMDLSKDKGQVHNGFLADAEVSLSAKADNLDAQQGFGVASAIAGIGWAVTKDKVSMAFGVISSLAALSASANIAGSTESMAVASARSYLKIVKPSGNALPLNGFNDANLKTGPGEASETEGEVGMATTIPGLFVGDRIAELLVLVAHAEATSILLHWSDIETSAQAILDANVDDFVVTAWVQ